MKKGLIAGAAATAALAAMPMAGVFAANVTDTVQLTVTESCNLTTSDSSTGIVVNLGNAAPGQALAEQNGTVMTVTCNSEDGWTLSANAGSLTFSGATKPIAFGAYGTTASVWSAKVTLGTANAANIATGWDSYAGANGTIVSGDAGTAVSGLTITPSYKAYVDAAQPAGTYSGTIEYTFTGL